MLSGSSKLLLKCLSFSLIFYWHFRRGIQWKTIIAFSSITLTLEGQTIPAASVESLWAQRAPLIATCWCTQVKGLINVQYVDSPSPPMETCTGECWSWPRSLERITGEGAVLFSWEDFQADWRHLLGQKMWIVCDLQVWHDTCTRTHTATTRMLKLWEEVGIAKGLLDLFTYYQKLLWISRSTAFLFGFFLLFFFPWGIGWIFLKRTKIQSEPVEELLICSFRVMDANGCIGGSAVCYVIRYLSAIVKMPLWNNWSCF